MQALGSAERALVVFGRYLSDNQLTGEVPSTFGAGALRGANIE